MKRNSICIFLMLSILMPAIAFAGGSNNSEKCNTKYPVVMVHGIAIKDNNLLGVNYWWGIVEALEDEGAQVYVTDQHCFQSHEYRACEIFKELLYIRAIDGHEKFNIIAHSQGALDARYLITHCSGTLPMSDRTRPGKRVFGHEIVSSLSTISGVHRGTALSDLTMSILPGSLVKFFAGAVDLFAGMFFYGETEADSLKAMKCLSKKYMTEVFNPNTPDMPGVYYQSWAGKIKTLTSELVLFPTWMILKFLEGDNDGLVSVKSAKWGKFRGVVSGAWWCGGVSHWNEINHLFGITPGFDAEGFYVDMVKELKKKGY